MAKKKRRGHGEGTVFLRKDGRWQASFIDSNGKRRYFYGLKQSEAIEKMRRAQEENRKGTLAKSTQRKLGEYLDQWLETIKKQKIRASTYVQYRMALDRHILPSLGNIQLQKLTPEDIQNLYADKQKSGLRPASILIMHTVLRGSLANALKWNLVSRNVAVLVSIPRQESSPAYGLSVEEAQQLVTTIRGHRFEAIFILALTTGMRRGELFGLRWNDINMERGILYVRRTANWYGKMGLVENDPKTKTSHRQIMLSEPALEVLKNHRMKQEQERLAQGDRWQNRNLVFCSKYGNFLVPDTLRRNLNKVLQDAGLPHIRFHDLRHSAATVMLTMGVHPKIVQEMLGHSTIAMTIDTYSHLIPSMQKEAIDKINKIFGDSEGK
ncbi:MAG TPA: tyrosine-type recombinase/integrase [Ktedonobacteraceae bacterium]|nr:tyrosine-type recombinase/integrase [Ktedonobacteraceae bacterium]